MWIEQVIYKQPCNLLTFLGGRQTLKDWHSLVSQSCVRTSFSKHFIATDVSVIGLKLFKVPLSGFLGIWMMMEDLNMSGTIVCVRKRLKMFVYTHLNCSTQVFGTLNDPLPGLGALWGLPCFVWCFQNRNIPVLVIMLFLQLWWIYYNHWYCLISWVCCLL